MKSIISVLQDFEKLVYKILMWVILIPKTLVYVILDPLKSPDYIDEELTQDKDSPFDEYMSPVVLLLVVAFLPALAFNFLPTFGSVITSPAETDIVTGRYVRFQAQTDFKAGSTKTSNYVHVWKVEKIAADGSYSEIYTEQHRDGDPGVYLDKVDVDTVTDQFVYNFGESGDYYVNVVVKKVDSARNDASIEAFESSIKVTIPPLESGQVIISSAKEKSAEATDRVKETGNFSERLKQEETIFLALALMIPPLLFAFASRFLLDRKKLEKTPAVKNTETSQLKIKATVEIAGDVLTESVKVPIQMKMPDTEKPADKPPAPAKSPVEYVSIGEETLKQSFYVQCYFFSPLSLAIWGTIYAIYFFTQDIFLFWSTGLYWQIMLLPLVLCVMWFLRTEVKYLSVERKIDTHWAVIVAVVCIAIIGFGAKVIFSFGDFKDLFRVWLIRAFPIASALLAGAFFAAWYNRRKKEKESILSRNGAGLLTVVFLFITIMIMIPGAVRIATPSSAPAAVQQAQRPEATDAPQATFAPTATPAELVNVPAPTSTQVFTPTPVLLLATSSVTELFTPTPVLEQPTAVQIPFTPTLVLDTATAEPSPFYVEEFDGDLALWSAFMTSGDTRMVKQTLVSGRLTVQLFQLDEKLPWYYLIRNGFSYSEVRVDAVVINKGNNTNGVSLICRYSDIGWYEFVISNSGFYSIYAVDNAGVMNQGYNLIADGSSKAITSGFAATNTYTITCQGDKLDLSINGKQVKTINEKIFKFSDGLIGIAVSSPQKLPALVEFESLTVSKP